MRPDRLAAYYDHHPIDAERVLAAARARRGPAGGPLVPEDLFDLDQDHYGGVAAVATLARLAGVGPGTRVLDVCAGLGGPARFLAARRGCRVVAVELHARRAAGAARLTRAVGLGSRVRVARGDATALPLARGSFDACLLEEGLLHVEDKAAALRECHRVLVPGGRLAFTDWIARPRLGHGERARLRAWMAATTLPTLDGYRDLLGRAGFGAIETEEVSDEWRPVVRARAERLLALADAGAVAVGFDPGWLDESRRVLAFFAGLLEAGKLGGGRFSGTA